MSGPANNRITTLLIANRGEIACRIIRTARQLGLRTVAIYSDADTKALHVRLADVACHVGPAPATMSYLDVDRIIKLARETGADAIHPGYGFLSENESFARACEAAGIVFVGPTTDAIRAMGSKGVARELMEKAGVPVLPGINELGDDLDAAAGIGFPLLIKPAAGGGGKGMKIVRERGALAAAVASARREAKSSFGDDTLIVERYLDGPRHVEVQVFGDRHGNAVHLAERDCSMQRRHQKIIEEAPAPGLSDALRKRLGDAAVAAARAIDYVGAGTVEFLVSGEDFYFMEMNTRLQVEHPVTECVTGLDLVAWQLAIAAGEPIPLQQEDIAIIGHAIEARVYAEDPEHDFLPASGRLDFLALPEGDGIRIDSGVAAGDRIGVFYDPMLMKVIARAPTREEAIHNLREALTGLEVAGIRTNRDFLIALLAHEPFIVSPLSTDYLDLHLGKLFHGPGDNEYRHLLSAAALHLLEPPRNGYSVWHDAPNFRLNQTTGTRLRLFCQGRIEEVEIAFDQDVACFSLADHSWRVRSVDVGILEIDGETQRYHVVRESEKLTVFGATRTLEFHLPREQDAASEDTGNVKAPMSGKIIAISVSVGERVEAGASLAVMEAMKMEHTLRAPADGTVKAVHFAPGDIVDEGSEILEIEESGE